MTQNKTPQMSSVEEKLSDEFRLYEDMFGHEAADPLGLSTESVELKPFPFQKVFITAIDADGRVVNAR